MRVSGTRCGLFFLLSYGVSWLLWAPLVLIGDGLPASLGTALLLLGSLVPSTIAIVLTGVQEGRVRVWNLLRRLLLWRVGVRWYLLLLAPTVLVLAATWLNSALWGGPPPVVGMPIVTAITMVIVMIFPGSASGEELGWRGYALPRLQTSRSALTASLMLGTAHGVWHLPLWLTGSPTQPLSLFVPFVLQVLALAVIYTWLYNSTGGSLLLAVLFHAATNVPLTLILAPLGSENLATPFWLLSGLMLLAALLVVAIFGPRNLARRPRQRYADVVNPGTRPQELQPSEVARAENANRPGE